MKEGAFPDTSVLQLFPEQVVVSVILPDQPDSEWDFHFDKIRA
jgi:hypothetical protein